MSFEAHVNEQQLNSLISGIKRLQGQLPTHQVNAARKSGDYLKEAMRRHARPMYFDGRVDRSIGWAESHSVVGGIVVGKSTVLVVGPGARGGREGGMPPEAPLMESGWKQNAWPNITRLAAWAKIRAGVINPREVYYIARALVNKGALSKNNPRAGGKTGYEYVQKTFDQDGQRVLEAMNDAGFGLTAKILREI